MTPRRVVEFLVLNPKFPASVRHSIGRVDGCIRRVSGNTDVAPKNHAERTVGRLYGELNYMSSDDIIAEGLHEFLDRVQVRCLDIGQSITECYLKF